MMFYLFVFFSSFFWDASIYCAPPSNPTSTKLNHLQVSLFGQPCSLTGPVTDSFLQAIHNLSPEQIQPGLNLEQLKKVFEKFKKSSLTPLSSPISFSPALESYREKMHERLEGQIAFLTTLDVVKKTGVTEALHNVFKKYLKNKSGLKPLELLLKKNEGKTGATAWNAAFIDEMASLFNQSIQLDPEEDFHRAIHKMNIHYTCSFEEEEGE